MKLKEQYLLNPCKTLSIPYWKHQSYIQPSSVKIIHQDDLITTKTIQNTKRFFRMINHLKDTYVLDPKVTQIDLSKDIDQLVDMLNKSYEHENIIVTKEQVLSWTKHDVYDKTLWVKIEEQGQIVASGIGEFDPDLKEGILEWIQVLPHKQGKGYGQKIVQALLYLLKEKANFVTVSGHLDNKYNPRKLYERCDFIGNDVWIIIEDKKI